MNGIEKITARIQEDSQKEIDAILAEAKAKAAEITAQAQAEAKAAGDEVLAQGRKEIGRASCRERVSFFV